MIYIILVVGSVGLTMTIIDLSTCENGNRIPPEVGACGLILAVIAFILAAGLIGYNMALHDIEHKNEPQAVEKVRDVE